MPRNAIITDERRPTSNDVDAEAVPSSSRVARERLSKTLWGIDWHAQPPVDVGSGVIACASSFDGALPFVREHYAAIFQEDGTSPFSTARTGGHQKERYYRAAGDFFEFKQGEKTVGLLVGTPVDWSTYYIRSAAVLPEFQGKGLPVVLLTNMFAILGGAGVERIEADTSPSNLATMRILTRLSFNVTGTCLSDRWGAQVRLTRFLSEQSEEVFLNQFCAGVRYQGRSPRHRVGR